MGGPLRKILTGAGALGSAAALAACSLLFAVSDDAAAGARSDASTGDGGAPDDDARVVDGPSLSCPQGKPGPELVAANGFCVDRTEVTAAQYAAFLDGGRSALALPPDCAGHAGLVPTLAAPSPDHPVLVDWCGAFAYCQWAGKRLCGALGDGGPLPLSLAALSSLKDPDRSEWVSACTGPQHWRYPYGNDLSPEACAPRQPLGGGNSPYQDMTPVGAHPACASAYGVLDLLGNAEEWVNSPLTAPELVDGGPVPTTRYYYMGSDECRSYNGAPRANDPATFGIRCCWSP